MGLGTLLCLALFVFQAAVGGLMVGRTDRFLETMPEPETKRSKVHQGGWVFLVTACLQGVSMLLLAARYVFPGRTGGGAYTRYGGDGEEARSNLNKLKEERTRWDADRKAQRKANANVDKAMREKYGQYMHNTRPDEELGRVGPGGSSQPQGFHAYSYKGGAAVTSGGGRGGGGGGSGGADPSRAALGLGGGGGGGYDPNPGGNFDRS